MQSAPQNSEALGHVADGILGLQDLVMILPIYFLTHVLSNVTPIP
jgi:hypothetical protein